MDVAPELLEKIEKSFEERVKNNQALIKLSAKLDKGEWGFLEAEHYALEVGKDLSAAFAEFLTVDSLPNGRMYYNIAEKIIPPMMYKEYELATDAALEVVSLVNERAGVRIAPQRPLIDENRVQGIVDKISDSEDFKSVQWLLGDPVQNFAVHCVDQTVETNALFQHRAGLRPRIKRDSGGKCCDWCAALDGMYEYPGVPRDIFMRHENCNCCVEYLPGDGSTQNVWDKTWRDMDEVKERIAFSERAMDNDEARERVLRLEGLDKRSARKQVSIGGSVDNVTREYFKETEPGKGNVVVEQDANVKRKQEEIRMAKWINKNIGGDIVVKRELPNQLNADYLWEKKLWELKTISTANAADAAIRKGMKQIMENPGGIVLDCRNCKDGKTKIFNVVAERARQKNAEHVDVLFVFSDTDYSVIRYK